MAFPGMPDPQLLSVSIPVKSVSDLFDRANEIRFEFKSLRLNSSSNPYLETLARQLLFESTVRLEIGVHVATTGNIKRDLLFSVSRAEVIKKELVLRGVAAHRLVTKGYGSEHPVAPSLTRTGRKRNERVELHRLAN
jgi:outer membrane protein OmpA-like peptidoglycan-associated protein